ncbi:MAG: glycerol-3-phosphate acyltransferase PlsX [Rhodospirillaceae bacterium]|nr:MAG: glycerol-3-phosphate acyltransferase PlsX [Rhodospirillaceae bacterium]
MTERLILSLDAMGGDQAPHVVVAGIELALRLHPGVHYLLYGDEAQLGPLLECSRDVAAVCTVRHTAERVSNDDKPSQVLRQGRKTSMWLAIQAVKDGEASGVISAGNTGALMAMAKILLRTLPGISRPAIATVLPSRQGDVVMLDLGANSDCDAQNLVEFAIMGEVFARTVLGLARPSIGLLNIGAEDMKGNEAVRTASALLRASPLPIRFHGFVEGDDIGAGTVDVVVTDGFTGNVALKTVEGTARLYAGFLRDAFHGSFLARLGYFLARPALTRVKNRTDPRRYNGAMFLGLNGVCVKSHGGTDDVGFANAIGVAASLVTRGFNDRIKDEFATLQFGAPSSAAVASHR